MAITDDDIQKVLSRCDDRYRHKEECDDIHSDVEKRQTATELTVAVHGTQLGALIKALLVIGTPATAALVAIAIKVLFGGS